MSKHTTTTTTTREARTMVENQHGITPTTTLVREGFGMFAPVHVVARSENGEFAGALCGTRSIPALNPVPDTASVTCRDCVAHTTKRPVRTTNDLMSTLNGRRNVLASYEGTGGDCAALVVRPMSMSATASIYVTNGDNNLPSPTSTLPSVVLLGVYRDDENTDDVLAYWAHTDDVASIVANLPSDGYGWGALIAAHPRTMVHDPREAAQAQYVSIDDYCAALREAWDANPNVAASLTDYRDPASVTGPARKVVAGDRIVGYFLILAGGELAGLFGTARGYGDAIVRTAVAAGARRLDCFDGPLVDLYERNGFREVDRADNWTPGGPDVVWMVLDA